MGHHGDVREFAAALADAIDDALPVWVERSVERVATGAGVALSTPMKEAAAEAGQRARQEVGGKIRVLLDADIDQQQATPLSLLRSAVRYPTEVLQAAEVPPVRRDAQQHRLFPDDVYDLAPATFADLGRDVGATGLAWAAAKAYTHLQRHGRP